MQKDFDEGEISRRYQQLCTELKFLYVAITRPKKRLFIYDEDVEARKPLEALWLKLGAIQKVTKEDLLAQQEEQRIAAAAAVAAAGQQIITTTDKGAGVGSLGLA